jgi:hypothetical protein
MKESPSPMHMQAIVLGIPAFFLARLYKGHVGVTRQRHRAAWGRHRPRARAELLPLLRRVVAQVGHERQQRAVVGGEHARGLRSAPKSKKCIKFSMQRMLKID